MTSKQYDCSPLLTFAHCSRSGGFFFFLTDDVNLVFYGLSTLFKSYQDDKRLITKGSMQRSTEKSRAEFCLKPNLNLGPHDSGFEINSSK